jgi:FKBP-type peptidyl-prolyl cis-trans isomerase
MRNAEVVKIIIPSHSAFGEKESSKGNVPLNETLINEETIR